MLKEKSGSSYLISLNPIHAMAGPNSSNFRHQISPLPFCFGGGRQVLRIGFGIG
jgi:hypothetical protein